MRDRLYVDVSGPYCGSQKLAAPWGDDPEFLKYAALAEGLTLLTVDRLWVLYSVAKQVRRIFGTWVECGVYKGGTTRMLASIAPGGFWGFDTFEGLPAPDPQRDAHPKGLFSDTSLESVLRVVPDNVTLIKGLLQDELDAPTVAFAHIDVDLYESVKVCCERIYPVLVRGGVMVFDDYGGYWEQGAADAVDEFFADKPEFPLILPTGQALVYKL